jgi:hypothetical protein
LEGINVHSIAMASGRGKSVRRLSISGVGIV